MIYQMEPWLGIEERQAVDAYLSSGGWLTEFKITEEFAAMIGAYVGSRHTSILSNGTVSLFTALAALGIGRGDEVIVPDYTMIATVNTVILCGAKPVFVDVDPHIFCLDLDRVESAITANTRAMIVVSINGRAPDMGRAQKIAADFNIPLIEDAAQSLGSFQNGRHLGTFGKIGSFSFSAPKIITTGQGGALVTNDDAVAEKIGMIRDFGRRQSGVDFHESIGYNFKFTDLQAVIGIEQMKKLGWRVARKKRMYALYRELLQDIEQITFPPTDLEQVPPWFMDILVPNPRALKDYLTPIGIGSRLFYPPIHSQPAYSEVGSFPNAEYASRHGLWLPSSASLDNHTIEHICREVKKFFRR